MRYLFTTALVAVSGVVASAQYSSSATKFQLDRSATLKRGDTVLYKGSPLIIGSFKLLRKDGVSLSDVIIEGKDSTGEKRALGLKSLYPNYNFADHDAFALDKPSESEDSLVTSTGYSIRVGQPITIGTGSRDDGDFKYIRITSTSFLRYYAANGDARGANSANAAPAEMAGMRFTVKRLEQRSMGNHGVIDYAVINSLHGGILKYEVDVERAIAAGELDVPEQYRPKKQTALKVLQPVSPADELAKLKKLKDEGVLTEEEFAAQKAKVLGR